jgi:hypothetical protein
MAEIREVSPPTTAAPQHTMSREGLARLAALSPEEKMIAPDGQETSEHRTRAFPTRAEADAERAANAKLVEDADGGTANTETGEYTPPGRPDPEPAPVDISTIPELAVPQHLAPTAQLYREDVAAIAADYPSLKDEAATLFEFIGQAAARDYQRDAKDSILSQGETAGPTLWNEHECLGILTQRYGQSQAQAILREASKHWQRLPDKVKVWLDSDMGAGARLGNHPDVVVGLALRAYAQMSPERARAELVQRRGGEKYGQGGALERDILHILNIIAARGQQQSQRPETPQSKMYGTTGEDALPTRGSAAAKSLRAELARLNAPGSDLWSCDAVRRKRAVARRQELQQQLGGAA